MELITKNRRSRRILARPGNGRANRRQGGGAMLPPPASLGSFPRRRDGAQMTQLIDLELGCAEEARRSDSEETQPRRAGLFLTLKEAELLLSLALTSCISGGDAEGNLFDTLSRYI